MKHLVHSWQGPCTQNNGSWRHHLVEDVEDPVDGVEHLGDGFKEFVDDGECIKEIMPLYVFICALMMSWYPKRRPNNPTSDVMINIDPWKSPGMVEVV